tara:strand:- start:1161 stop:1328 length:168 start_codon:yes stop_codon:yes gene_type:complete
MTAKILFAFSFVSLVGLQGVSIALGGRIGKVSRKISYMFAIIAVCSYAIFLKDVL